LNQIPNAKGHEEDKESAEDRRKRRMAINANRLRSSVDDCLSNGLGEVEIVGILVALSASLVARVDPFTPHDTLIKLIEKARPQVANDEQG